MRTFIRIFIILLLSLFVSSCAAGLLTLPEKYSLDGQLAQVDGIYKYRLMEWDKVDQQSLILRTGPSDYYLLVLKIPAPELLFTNRIRISSSASMVRAGMDDVILLGPGRIRSSYTIERIYRIKGHQQMAAIKEQLTSEANDSQQNNRTTSKSLKSI